MKKYVYSISNLLVVFALFPGLLFAASKEKLDRDLIDAASVGDVAKTDAALQAGADVNAKDEDGWTALMLGAGSDQASLGVVQTLLQAHADANRQDPTGHSALMLASARGLTEIVQALVNAGADINQIDQAGRTALMNAA